VHSTHKVLHHVKLLTIFSANIQVKSCSSSMPFVFVPCLIQCFFPDANLDMRVGLSKPLSSITSIPTSWSWTYTSASSDLVADVSYDLWLSTVPNSTGATFQSTYEMCVFGFRK